MQDKYAGDVGDFGKYGLLNEVYKKSDRKVRLGVNWYYVIGEEKKTGDGRYTDYLCDSNKNSKNYKICFPVLYDKLKGIVKSNRRNIREIQNSSVLPKATIFHSKPLPYLSTNPVKRQEDREKWFEESLAELKMTDMVFLDPDNGVQTDRVKKTHKRARKYVFRDEIQRYYESGKSLIIYTHRDRTKESEYMRRLFSVETLLKAGDEVKVLKFKRVSVRYYVFLVRKEHNDFVVRTIESLTKEPCDFLFEVVHSALRSSIS